MRWCGFKLLFGFSVVVRVVCSLTILLVGGVGGSGWFAGLTGLVLELW